MANSKRNLVKQEVILKDGSKKNIFHKKRFHSMDFKSFWSMLDKQPRENSKRQLRLKAEMQLKEAA